MSFVMVNVLQNFARAKRNLLNVAQNIIQKTKMPVYMQLMTFVDPTVRFGLM